MGMVSGVVQEMGESLGKSLSLSVGKWVPQQLKATALLRSFGLLKVPMILYCAPVVEALDDARCVVRIPLMWRTKNHFNAMYFGALAVGADCTGGLLAMHHIRQRRQAISLVFKDFSAEFLRRPDSDVRFVCADGLAIAQAVQQAADSGERVNHPMPIEAWVRDHADPVARFTLTLSLKRSSKTK